MKSIQYFNLTAIKVTLPDAGLLKGYPPSGEDISTK
jgi:hypothetical protein